MAEDNFTLTTFYTSWKEYQDHIKGAPAPLTARWRKAAASFGAAIAVSSPAITSTIASSIIVNPRLRKAIMSARRSSAAVNSLRSRRDLSFRVI